MKRSDRRSTGSVRLTAAALVAAVLCLQAGCGLRPLPGVSLPQADAAPAACHSLDGIAGAEDITVDAQEGLAYVSSTDRRAMLNGDPPVSPDGRVGHIYRIDLNVDPVRIWDVTPASLRQVGFAPHGISLIVLPDGERRLFVINHRATYDPASRRWRSSDAASRVEIMPFTRTARGGEELGLEDPVEHGLLVSPNDVAAVGPRSFYATNDHGQPAGLEAILRDILGLNDGFLVYHDGTRTETVGLTLPWANGVQADLRAQRLYVASSSRGTITTLAWEDRHPARALSGTFPLGTGVDNIEIDHATGDLLVAAHPSALRLVALRYRLFGEASPSQVIRLARDAEGRPRVAGVVLHDDGDEARPGRIAGATVAAPYHRPEGRRLLLMGSVFSRFVLLCHRDAAPLPAASR